MNDLALVTSAFDRMFRDFDSFWTSPDFHSPYSGTGFPPYNAYIDEEDYSLTFEFALAGIPKEIVEVTFDGDALILTVEEQEEKERHYFQRRIKTGRSVSKFVVPASKYNTTEAEGTMKDGILTVTIPARESTKPRTLELT